MKESNKIDTESAVTNMITEKQKKRKFQNNTNALIKNYYTECRIS